MLLKRKSENLNFHVIQHYVSGVCASGFCTSIEMEMDKETMSNIYLLVDHLQIVPGRISLSQWFEKIYIKEDLHGIRIYR